LVLALRVGGLHYALPTRVISEVIPLVSLRVVPHAPDYVAGVCNYRGRVAPVVDLGVLISGTRSRRRLSTRIVMVEHTAGASGVLGVMAEGVTETLEIDDSLLSAGTQIRSHDTPYLGVVIQHEIGMIQMFEPDCLIAPAVHMPELLDGGRAGEES